jgi:hypothetical protein
MVVVVVVGLVLVLVLGIATMVRKAMAVPIMRRCLHTNA